MALQITNLLVSLSKNRNSLVFISHDLNAARTTQYLAVMFKGEILEKGPIKKYQATRNMLIQKV